MAGDSCSGHSKMADCFLAQLRILLHGGLARFFLVDWRRFSTRFAKWSCWNFLPPTLVSAADDLALSIWLGGGYVGGNCVLARGLPPTQVYTECFAADSRFPNCGEHVGAVALLLVQGDGGNNSALGYGGLALLPH